MDAHTRFSKFKLTCFSLLTSLVIAVAAPQVSAETPAAGEKDISLLAKEGLELMQQVEAGDLSMFPDLKDLNTQPAKTDITPEFLLQQAPDWLKKQQALVGKNDKEIVYLFASRAMPEHELMELFREASGRSEVHVVFRGIYPEENFGEAFQDIHRIISKAKLDEQPNVLINPVVFRKFGVKEVPEIVYARGDRDLIRAQGSFSVDWILEEYKVKGSTGDLGAYGTVTVVSEMDLIELMKQRLQKIDLEAKRQEIVDNYWLNKKFVPIEKARKNSRRKVDPTVIVHQDIVAPDGTVVAKAGDRTNPLFIQPFTYKIIIFDARDKNQVEFVKRKVRDYPETQLVQLIASHITKEKGWDHLKELDQHLGHPVYILNSEVQQRFGISNVPSLIEADDRYFYIEEFDVQSIKEAG